MSEQPQDAPPKTQLSGTDQAALLLMALGEEYAAEILKHMEPRELHLVSAAMAQLANIDRDQISSVLHAFNLQADNQTSIGVESKNYVRGVLVRALGRDKAKSVLDSIFSADGASGVDSLKWLDADAIAGSLQDEHPQVVALVLASLEADQAAAVAATLPAGLRGEALMRVASLGGVSKTALDELNQLIEKQVLGNASAAATAKLGGPKRAAEILNLLDSEVEHEILDRLKEADQELGRQVEELMVVFDCLLEVDDRGIQTLLREVSSNVLVVALRGTDEAMQQKLLSNLSKRAAQLLRDDLEAMAPVKLSEVEEAQREIIAVAKRLADEGRISLGGGEQFV